MAVAGGAVSTRCRQGLLLRTTGLPRTQPGLLIRRTRWVSNQRHARSRPSPPDQLHLSKARDPTFSKHAKGVIKFVHQNSFVECKEPVRLVGTETECLCSWNEASGPRQAIQVPGDASRPRTAGVPLTKDKTLGPLHPSGPSSYHLSGPWRGPRWGSWDDGLAALCAMKPDLKLNDVDVMVHDHLLLHLLGLAQDDPWAHVAQVRTIAFTMSVVDQTLVIQRSILPSHSPTTTVPSENLKMGKFYRAAMDSAPDVEHSLHHNQLLRYNIGPLTCVVRATVNGTVQKMPEHTSASAPKKTRDIHGIRVIAAGQGVQTPLAFHASARHRPAPGKERHFEHDHLKKRAPHLWVCGQTRLGLADMYGPRGGAPPDGLTVVDVGELVVDFERENQQALRRLAGLLTALRDFVRARGEPCKGIIYASSVSNSGATFPPRGHALYIYGARREPPVLLDWHKEHFWGASSDHTRPQERADNEDTRPRKGVVRKLAEWFGF